MYITYSELIKTLILDPIEVANGESWVFKIEVFKSQKGYFAQLWRQDSYDIKPISVVKQYIAKLKDSL